MQNKKPVGFSGLCFLNPKPTEEEEVCWKKRRGLGKVAGAMGFPWAGAREWWAPRGTAELPGLVLGWHLETQRPQKEMIPWAPKGAEP